MSDPDLADEVTEDVTVDLPTDLAQKLIDTKQALDEVKEFYEELRDQVIAILRDRGDGRVHARAFGGTVCTYSRYYSSRLDYKKLKREFPDVYAQYVTSSTHDRLAFPKAVTK